MTRTTVVFALGACVLAVAAFLVLQGDELATTWKGGAGGYGRVGVVDDSLRRAYRTLGLAGLGLGSGLVGMAAWHWLAAGRRDRYGLPGLPA
jgi:hypothetical protein